MYDNEFETRNIKFKPITKLNHNIYIILAVLIDSDQERISLRASSPIWASLARMRERGAAETKLVTQTKRVPAWPVINQLCFPERHFSANGISFRLSEVQMKFHERSLQALFSSGLCPSRLRHSLARFRETRFARPNRRACSQAKKESIILLQWCVKSVKESNKPVSNYCIHRIFSNERPRSNKHLQEGLNGVNR